MMLIVTYTFRPSMKVPMVEGGGSMGEGGGKMGEGGEWVVVEIGVLLN